MAKGKGSVKAAKASAGSTTNVGKIIAIAVALVAGIALLLGLTCCNKDTDPKKLQGKVINDKDKKEDDTKDVVLYYGNIADLVPAQMAFEPANGVEEAEEEDTEEPVVTLAAGTETINIEYLTDVYSELGATYSDNVDGDGTISEPTRITLGGSPVQFVANDILGEYTLIYTYTDAAGNTGMATRTVIVRDTKGPQTNISVSVRRTSDTGNTYNRSYTFDAADPSDVKVVKCKYFAAGTTPTQADFDDGSTLSVVSTVNGINYYAMSVNETGIYTGSVAGNYYVYSEDQLGNYNIRKIATVAVTENTESTSGLHANVVFDEVEGYEISSVVSIHEQSRLKSNVTVTSDSFEAGSLPKNPNNNNDYVLVNHTVENNAIVLDTNTNNGDHWHYVYCNYENSEDGTTQEFISNPIAPEDY